MFSKDSRIEDIMSSMRLIADACLTPNPIKDTVSTSEFSIKMWHGFVAGDATIAKLRKETIAYQVIRGLWLLVYGGAELLPVEKVHLSYTVAHSVVKQISESTGQDELRQILDAPGGMDQLVAKVTVQVFPASTLMWGEEHADQVHQLLDGLIALDPKHSNFREMFEAWMGDVREKLPEDLASRVIQVAGGMRPAMDADDFDSEDFDEDDDGQGHANSHPITQSHAGPTEVLDYASMVKLYEAVRHGFQATLQDGQKQMVVNTINFAVPIMLVISELREHVALFGMLESESALVRNMDLGAKATVLRYFQNERFRHILDQFGKMIGAMPTELAEESRLKNEDSTESDRIEDLNGAGYSLMVGDEDQFDARHATASLPTQDRGSKGDEQGPLITCVDNSGSMGGQKDIWSKALILAAAERAFRQNRAVGVIIFTDHVNTRDVLLVMPPSDAARIMEMVMRMPEGGTNFEQPLRWSMQILDTQQNWREADILFITDGEAVVGSEFLREFLEKKRALDFAVHSVVINVGGGAVTTKSVRQFSDTVRLATDLTEGLAGEVLDLV